MNRRLIIFVFIILASCAPTAYGHSGYGSPLADSLMQLHNIANIGGNFNGISGAQIDSTYKYGRQYSAAPVLYADHAAAYQLYLHAQRLELVWSKENPQTRAMTKAVTKLFDALSASGQCRVRKLLEYRQVLVMGGRDILDYSFYKEAGSLVINIYQTPTVLADESAYGGKFPELPTPGTGPQVTVYHRAGCGPDAVERDNGIFADGVLISGSKTIRGCNDYLNGTWYSDDWRTTGKDWARAYVWVAPASSTADTILGCFAFASMEQFSPDKQYAVSYNHSYYRGVFQATKRAPEWIRVSYVEQEAKRAADIKAAEARYRSEHPYETYHPTEYVQTEADKQYEQRQARWKARWTFPKDAFKQDPLEAQKKALHQEAVDYYNKIHPYGEGTNDINGNPIR